MTRSTVFQTVRVGVEATAGTLVTATANIIELTALSIEPRPNTETYRFTPHGQKYDTLVALGKDWTTANVTGAATYTELVYPLSSALDTATVSTGTATGTGSGNYYTWVFEPDKDAADAPKTFSVYTGDGTIAERFTYGILNDFGVTFTRDSVELEGAMLGQLYTTGATLPAAGGGSISLLPVLPTQVDVYLDTAVGNLGNTKLTNVIRAEWRLTGRYGTFWTINSANSSWASIVELKPTLELKLQMEANSTAMGYMSLLRAGTARWLRIKGTGTEIGSTNVNHSLTIDTKVQFVEASDLSDSDGVMAIEYTFTGVPESTWAGPTKWTLINGIDAL